VVKDHRTTPEAIAAPRSRRAALRAAGGGLAVAAAALLANPASAQSDDLPDVVAEFLAAWEAFDPDRIAATFAEDGIREDITAGVIAQNRAEVLDSVTTFFAAFEGASVAHPVAFAAGDQAVESWVFTGRYVGTLPGLPPGTGEPLTIRGLTLIDLANGLIQRTTDYYDHYGILTQLGAAPPVDQAQTPEATPAS
jgi:steroid delta-isomerase-like uncharacterized protein